MQKASTEEEMQAQLIDYSTVAGYTGPYQPVVQRAPAKSSYAAEDCS
jgi:hypothetical protein